MTVVYIGIGSNIGDREKNCLLLVDKLKERSVVHVVKSSLLYETEPVGGPVQEKHINGVVKMETSISPGELLEILKSIEREMGRAESQRNYPRVIDADILLYGDLVLEEKDLTIPHSRLHERYFVLKGLNEIAPDEKHPVLNKTVAELYQEVLVTN